MAQTRKISKLAIVVPTAALVLVALVVGLSALRGSGAEANEDASASAPMPVPTATVAYSDQTRTEARYPGQVTARRESGLGFEQGGRIAALHVDIGDRVDAGDLLAERDTRALDAQLSAARADADAALAQAELSALTLERRETLLERGHISQQGFDETAANARAAQAQANAARAGADALAVQLDLARLEAPFAGIVTARHFDEGAVAGPGAPVLTLVEAGTLELQVGLPAGTASALSVGTVYSVEIDGETYAAPLRRMTGVVDRQSRSVTAVFDLSAGHDSAPVTGAIGRLVLETPLNDRGFWAPISALAQGRRGLWSVYVLEGEGPFTLAPHPVEILHTAGDRVYITGAVADGTVILASGLQRVAPGQRVTPAEAG